MKLRSGKVINESFVGYKKALNNHLVVLEIPLSAQHNMNRHEIKDKKFAKYRCSEAVVKEIVDLNTGKTVNEAYSFHKFDFKYVKGHKVVPDKFDPNIDKVCSGGIHFFLDRQCAEFYEDGKKEGEYKSWYDNGQLYTQGLYKDGKKEGEHKIWHDNGQLYTQGLYKDGKKEGEHKIWYRDGQLFTQGLYKDGILQ
jgi:antitoxin component YwqK of YwqJK toxin-antitoxin module